MHTDNNKAIDHSIASFNKDLNACQQSKQPKITNTATIWPATAGRWQPKDRNHSIASFNNNLDTRQLSKQPKLNDTSATKPATAGLWQPKVRKEQGPIKGHNGK